MPPFRPPPRELLSLAARRSGYVTTRQCTEAGVGADARRRRIEAGLWARAATGVVDLEPGRERTIPQERLRAVHLSMVRAGPGAAAVGVGALVLHGSTGLPVRIDPRAARPDGQPRRGGLTVQHARFATVMLADGARAAALPVALAQAAAELDRLHLTAVVDSALHTGALTSTDEVLRLATGRRGARLLRECVALSDARAESFLETWARLQCTDAGIPPDVLQLPIVMPDGRTARGDLAWRLPGGRWLVVEIDGREVHDRPDAVYRDRSRQNDLVGSGRVVVLRFTAADLRCPGYVPARIRQVLGR